MPSDSVPTAFFERVDDDRFVPSDLTRGPWDAGSQHAGPPAALLGRAVDRRIGARDDMRIARITFDIVKPVPIAPLTVATRVVHGGRSVELVEATLTADGGPIVMRASALRIRVASDGERTLIGRPAAAEMSAVLGPDGAKDKPFPFHYDVGYHTAMQLRFVRGSFPEAGPATCWLRMRYPLVAGEEIDALTRVLIAADSGNGVSNVFDPTTHLFINPELTVHLLRYPVGEWICLDASTAVDPAGIGLTAAALHDQQGRIGRGTQSLLIAPRG